MKKEIVIKMSLSLPIKSYLLQICLHFFVLSFFSKVPSMFVQISFIQTTFSETNLSRLQSQFGI